jgi:hypothetical protein
MKLPSGIEKWAIAVLGVVSVLLLAHLVSQFRGARARASQTVPAPTRAAGVRTGQDSTRSADDLARYDPVVHLEALEELDARPLPDMDRNPFDFVAPPPPEVTPQQLAAVAQAVPAPPPPVLLKPMGYNEMPGGGKEAFATLEDQVLVVHEGEVVASRYKILRITPMAVTVEDATSHQVVDLPIPQ